MFELKRHLHALRLHTTPVMILIKSILVLIVIIGMLVLLASVRLLTHPIESTDTKETDQMRKELESDEDVITPHSVFHKFLRDRRS